MPPKLWIEPMRDIIVVRARGIPSEAILKECRERILRLVEDTGQGHILTAAIKWLNDGVAQQYVAKPVAFDLSPR